MLSLWWMLPWIRSEGVRKMIMKIQQIQHKTFSWKPYMSLNILHGGSHSFYIQILTYPWKGGGGVAVDNIFNAQEPNSALMLPVRKTLRPAKASLATFSLPVVLLDPVDIIQIYSTPKMMLAALFSLFVPPLYPTAAIKVNKTSWGTDKRWYIGPRVGFKYGLFNRQEPNIPYRTVHSLGINKYFILHHYIPL